MAVGRSSFSTSGTTCPPLVLDVAAGGLAFAATERVVDGVHGDAADARALALPAHPAGLAPADVGLLRVADLADRCAAAQVDVADLTGGHAQLRVRTVLRDQLHTR